MGKIQVLSQETINQIAAGEVIERPSSVVKELVENAMDAGATAVTVEVKDGGISFIRVTDNGSGIAREDIPTAFLRHSTSKIRDAEDLSHVGSLGFRGEALSSIAAVSQVELITCAAGQTVGSRYRIEGGEEIGMEDIGAPEGTTFIMRNLFYNTPVRRKFLKTPMTEASYISDLMERMALSHPDVSFRLSVNGQLKLHTAGNHNLKDIVYSVFGREVTASLIPIEARNDIVSISGFLGAPLSARGNRSYEVYFVNGRYVRSNVIQKGLEDGYKSYLMQHKYPLVILHLQVEPEYLDVNVHPTKMELRFRGEQQIYEFLVEAVRSTLLDTELIPKVSLMEEEKNKKTDRVASSTDSENHASSHSVGPEPFEKNRLQDFQIKEQQEMPNLPKPEYVSGRMSQREKSGGEASEGAWDASSAAKLSAIREPDTGSRYGVPEKVGENTRNTEKSGTPCGKKVPDSAVNSSTGGETAPVQPALKNESRKRTSPEYTQGSLFEDKMITPEKRAQFRIIGQLFDTYWLLEMGKQFLIIDQHAAHEKILYERTMKRLENETIQAQMVAPPIILSLSPLEIDTVEHNQEAFERMGFSLEPFGGQEYAVRSVPDHLYGIADRTLLLEMIDELSQDTGKAGVNLLAERVATASCKAAVKGNSRLSRVEAEKLLDELFTLDNPYTCPHGRPIFISMSQYEIEKKFKRIV